MVDFGTIALSVVGAIIVAFIGPYLTHKMSIRYLKKKYFFQEKIKIFEQIGAIGWRLHLNLTELEVFPQRENIIKLNLSRDLANFSLVLDKSIYMNKDLMKNLGKYLDLFERYLESKEFGSKQSLKELKERASPFAKEIGKLIEKEIKRIR